MMMIAKEFRKLFRMSEGGNRTSFILMEQSCIDNSQLCLTIHVLNYIFLFIICVYTIYNKLKISHGIELLRRNI